MRDAILAGRAQFIITPFILLLAISTTKTFARSEWKADRTVHLDGLTVTVSEPVKVAESKGYLWFPTLVKLNDRRLLAVMSNKADEHTNEQTADVAWSNDGGLTWGERQPAPIYSECPLATDAGTVLLPNYLFPQEGGAIGAPYLFAPTGKSELVRVAEPLVVTGFPRKPGMLGAFYGHPELNVAGFVFNGQCVPLKDGRHLTTLYGRYEGSKRYDLVVAGSKDGKRWDYLSSVADETCKLDGAEGPCEAALCRLKDQRLMCVFRLEGNKPYGRSFSSDEGKTWSEPAAIDARSVQPSLVMMPDGVVALSGGRPGVFAWFNVNGDGIKWQPIELLSAAEKTSAYTELVVLDDRNILCIYDRIPHGWGAIPADSNDRNSVWVVRLTLQK